MLERLLDTVEETWRMWESDTFGGYVQRVCRIPIIDSFAYCERKMSSIH